MTSTLPDSVDFRQFWTERHLCTVTTLRADGSPHVVPMGVALDLEAEVAWAITAATSQKVRNLRSSESGAVVAVCQVDGARWSTLEGRAVVRSDEASVQEAVRRYTERYRVPRPNPHRVALRIDVTGLLGNVR